MPTFKNISTNKVIASPPPTPAKKYVNPNSNKAVAKPSRPVPKVQPVPVKEEPKVEETPVEEEKVVEEPVNVKSTFKPIRRTQVSQDVEKELNSRGIDPDKKLYALDQEGIVTMTEAIVAALSEKFVAKNEVEDVVTKILQKMVVDNSNAEKPKKTAQPKTTNLQPVPKKKFVRA